jgi:ribosomal protein S6--L-glutamate ligase
MKVIVLSRNPKLYSTKRLVETAVERGHHCQVIDHTKCYMIMEKGNPAIYYDGKKIEADAIIPRVGASVTAFGAAVVRQFEVMNVFCANGSQAITRSRDKLRSIQIMSQQGLGIPLTVFAKYPKDKDVHTLINQIGGTPLIIKVLEGTQGLGVILAETEKSAVSIIEGFSGLKTNILVQEFIKEAGGADIRAFIVDGEIVGAMKRQGKEGDFRSNLHRGGNASIIELSDEEKNAAILAAKSMDLSVAGVDLLQSSRGPLILEVNSSPGLKGIESATGINVAGKILEYLENHVEGKKAKNKDEM